MAQLIVHFGSQTKRFDVTGTVVLGRSSRCDLVLNVSQVSRQHARISLESGQLTIEDLDSRNGTWVNEARITGKRVLLYGDEIRLSHKASLTYPDPSVEVDELPLEDQPAGDVLFRCPDCHRRLKAAVSHVGKKGSCQACGTRFIVPEISGSDASALQVAVAPKPTGESEPSFEVEAPDLPPVADEPATTSPAVDSSISQASAAPVDNGLSDADAVAQDHVLHQDEPDDTERRPVEQSPESLQAAHAMDSVWQEQVVADGDLIAATETFMGVGFEISSEPPDRSADGNGDDEDELVAESPEQPQTSQPVDPAWQDGAADESDLVAASDSFVGSAGGAWASLADRCWDTPGTAQQDLVARSAELFQIAHEVDLPSRDRHVAEVGFAAAASGFVPSVADISAGLTVPHSDVAGDPEHVPFAWSDDSLPVTPQVDLTQPDEPVADVGLVAVQETVVGSDADVSDAAAAVDDNATVCPAEQEPVARLDESVPTTHAVISTQTSESPVEADLVNVAESLTGAHADARPETAARSRDTACRAEHDPVSRSDESVHDMYEDDQPRPGGFVAESRLEASVAAAAHRSVAVAAARTNRQFVLHRADESTDEPDHLDHQRFVGKDDVLARLRPDDLVVGVLVHDAVGEAPGVRRLGERPDYTTYESNCPDARPVASERRTLVYDAVTVGSFGPSSEAPAAEGSLDQQFEPQESHSIERDWWENAVFVVMRTPERIDYSRLMYEPGAELIARVRRTGGLAMNVPQSGLANGMPDSAKPGFRRRWAGRLSWVVGRRKATPTFCDDALDRHTNGTGGSPRDRSFHDSLSADEPERDSLDADNGSLDGLAGPEWSEVQPGSAVVDLQVTYGVCDQPFAEDDYDDDRRIACPTCGRQYHLHCWRWHRGCASLDCSSVAPHIRPSWFSRKLSALKLRLADMKSRLRRWRASRRRGSVRQAWVLLAASVVAFGLSALALGAPSAMTIGIAFAYRRKYGRRFGDPLFVLVLAISFAGLLAGVVGLMILLSRL